MPAIAVEADAVPETVVCEVYQSDPEIAGAGKIMIVIDEPQNRKPHGGVEPPTLRLRVSRSTD